MNKGLAASGIVFFLVGVFFVGVVAFDILGLAFRLPFQDLILFYVPANMGWLLGLVGVLFCILGMFAFYGTKLLR